ncbi:MAG: TrkA C-terminal domain-containing protein [Patescibacteria group bacterium]
MKEVKIKIPVSVGSKIVGKTIGEVEEKFKISILELDNTNDRAFLFSWEITPDKSTTIQPEDEIVIFGKPLNIQRFSKSAASLN